MATLDHMSLPAVAPYAIYEDTEEHEPPSPSDMFAGDVSFGSELAMARAEEPVPSIELEHDLSDEPEPYQSSYTSRKSLSRRQSAYSFVSALPSESGVPAVDQLLQGKFSPRKERPRFRNPESVRAMQMASPLPMSAFESSRERMKNGYPISMSTPNRSARSERSVSRRSGSHRGSVSEHRSPKPAVAPQQAPLVLLHVTILPMQLPYGHDLMGKIMPDWLVENYRLLQEKLQDIVLMRRGLLIPHPRDEFDLLEERILESLELKTPRLLRCGHFVAPEDDSDKEDDRDCASIEGGTGRGSRMSGGTMTEDHECKDVVETGDASMCMDCHRHLKKPGRGVGAGSHRWDIKIYAANGLMRSEAWNAAWTEMERCDVEISPWIPEDVRKTLEKRIAEEKEAAKRKQAYAAEVQRRAQEDNAIQQQLKAKAAEKKRQEEEELRRSFEAAAAALQRSIEDKADEKQRFEETLEEKIEEAKEAIRLEFECLAQLEANSVADRLRAMEEALEQQQKRTMVVEHARSPSPLDPNLYLDLDVRSVSRGRRGYTNSRPRAAEMPLSTLLKNYMHRQLHDGKNWLIVLLSVLLLVFSMDVSPNVPSANMLDVPQGIVSMASEASVLESVVTSFATVTVTEAQIPAVAQPTTAVEHIQDLLVEEIGSAAFETSAVEVPLLSTEAEEPEVIEVEELEIAEAMEPEVVDAVEPEVAEAVEAVESEVVEAVDAGVVETMEPHAAEAVESEVAEAVESEVAEAVESEVVETVEADAIEAVESDAVEAAESDAVEVMESEVAEATEPMVIEAIDTIRSDAEPIVSEQVVLSAQPVDDVPEAIPADVNADSTTYPPSCSAKNALLAGVAVCAKRA
jgi:hypothetical protein